MDFYVIIYHDLSNKDVDRMDKYFRILLTQLNINTDLDKYEGCILKNLEINKNDYIYTFYFEMSELLEPHDCYYFYERLINRFKQIKDVKQVNFNTIINNKNKDYNLFGYFNVVKQLLLLDDNSIIALDDYHVQFDGEALYIEIKSEQQKKLIEERFKAPIEKMFNSIGLLNKFNVRLSENGTCTFEDIDKRKLEQDLLFSQQLAESKKEVEVVENKSNDNGYYRRQSGTYSETQVGSQIKTNSEPISNIPLSQEELHAAKVEYVIEGYIFACDTKTTSKGTHMIDFAITDYNDSISVKVFVKNNDQIEYYDSVFKLGNYVKLKGNPKYDDYRKEVILFCNTGEVLDNPIEKKTYIDKGFNGETRIELHVHTNMSNLDSVVPISKYVERALTYNHEAIALTDHHGMYALPELYNSTKGKNIKPIYGVEVNIVEDEAKIAWNEKEILLKDAEYVVFDLETTGFSVNYENIIEVAAVKIKNGHMAEEFNSFCNPHRKLSSKIIELTNIKDSDVMNAPEIPDVLIKFKEFCGDAIMVAHNATFDMSHIDEAYDKYQIGKCDNPVIDTLEYARNRYGEDLKRFNLKALTKFFKVELTQHHRAIYDTKATAEVFLHLLKDMEKNNINYHHEINNLIGDAYKHQIPKHVTLLARNEAGLKNLFKIVSDSHTVHFHKEPRVLRSFLNVHRDNIFVGSSCVEGQVFKTALERNYNELLQVAKYFDYLEVQPPEVYSHLVDTVGVAKEHIIDTIKKIIRAGNELGIPVVASGDVHHLDREDKIYREIYIDTPQTGGGYHPLANSDIKEIPSMHFRTTDEMFKDFSFLPTDLAKEIIIDNPKKIVSQIEVIKAIKDKLYTPKDDFLKEKGIPSIDNKLRELCYEKATSIYGETLPPFVKDRLDKEVNSIVKHGFAVIYYISHMLVKKSLDDGYVVGSRGSVGSSFVATMMDITEVNPLSPHYKCPNCNFSSFKMNEEEKTRYQIKEIEKDLQVVLDTVDSGFDLPDASCPICGTNLKKDGHDIPFETFLGFEGDKVPDIDLNFSGEYQPRAHAFCQEVFGFDRAFRAGTIGTVAEKTAFGYVRGYFEKREIHKREPEIRRIAAKCEGAKRTTGQHPGGIIVVPDYMEIYDITPIQYPADNGDNAFRTTHFDFHSIHDNLLKLDILGHDDPTMLRYLEDLTGISPKDIPIDDPKVYQLFCSTESLGVTPDKIMSNTGSYGVPEFGTFFVRNMLEDTRPSTFAELVKISGLSHGTDVWANNAQDLVDGKYPEYGEIKFKELIGCRDDIMVNLMYWGLEPKQAFDIMEFVRKGKPSKEKEKWEKYTKIMKEKDVPDWYIWSCGQIQYMFPKAHATAYVLMAIRIAWFKVNMPIHYYAAYFSKRADVFDVNVLVKGAEVIRNKILEINKKGFEASEKEKSLITILELALEMTERGFYFQQVNLDKSSASEFVITEDEKGLIIPFSAIDGLGVNVANSVVEARIEKPFISKEDLSKRTSLSKTLIEKLGELGCLDHLTESNQISLFDELLYN
ncbi:MAG: polC [Haloplasmataceae bacterium]|jgi:DNA polymerase-3 subunit alpha (Gram-positive type)|nr:polC [Haloplasmataceae bacterium]